jgi:hypothetical protein
MNGATTMKTQWQLYKSLEQIPDSVSEPQFYPQETALTRWCRSLVNTLSGKEPDILNLEHLERCWAIELSPDHPPAAASRWQQWWKSWHQSWHQSLSLRSDSITTEPEVWCSVDHTGQSWWHVYSPRTGERVDFASEDEVCLWIEQSFYR